MAKVAKVASKNSPSQRGKVVTALYEGKPVTKVILHSRSGGRKNVTGCVAFKESVASASAGLLIKKPNGEHLIWNELTGDADR